MLFSYLKLKNVYSLKNLISIVQFRSLYTSSVFGLKHFESLRKETQNRAGKEFEDLKKKLENSKEINNAENLKIEELNKFLLLIKNVDPDLNLAIHIFKLFLKDNFLNKERNFGELLAKTDFLLNTNDANQAIQLLNDTDIQPSLMSQISTFILMIKFYKYNHHKEVFQCFITYIEYLNENVIGLKHPTKYKLKSQQQLVPFGHLRLVTSSLLCLNTKESYEQMKIVVQLASTCKSFLSNNSLASCFLLSFYQNDIAFAMKIVNRISPKNPTLKKNLEAIAYCHEKDLKQAIISIENILELRENPAQKFQGKVFRLTLESYKKLAEQTSDKYFDKLVEKMSERIFKVDLFEYCTEMNDEFNNK